MNAQSCQIILRLVLLLSSRILGEMQGTKVDCAFAQERKCLRQDNMYM